MTLQATQCLLRLVTLFVKVLEEEAKMAVGTGLELA